MRAEVRPKECLIRRGELVVMVMSTLSTLRDQTKALSKELDGLLFDSETYLLLCFQMIEFRKQSAIVRERVAGTRARRDQ